MTDTSKIKIERIDELITELSNLSTSITELNQSFTDFKALTNATLENFQETVNEEFAEMQTSLSTQITNVQTSLTSDISAINSKINGMIYITEKTTSSNKWYRKWSDGWIEQGGYEQINSSGQKVTMLKSFSNTNYTIVSGGGTSKFGNTSCYNKTINSFQNWTSDDDSFNAGILNWYACGF